MLKKMQFKTGNRGHNILLLEEIVGKLLSNKSIVYQMCTYYWYSQRNCDDSNNIYLLVRHRDHIRSW